MSDEDGDAVRSAGDVEEPPADSDRTDADPDHEDEEPPIEEIATLREEVAALETERDDLQADRDDLESRLKRKQAEFQNYKKRQEKRREKERARATEALVEELLEVRDNLRRALEQDESADIREGVEATFRQLDEVLDSEGVEPVEPDPGTPTDPTRHEVLLGVESDSPEGTVAEVHRPGYEMAEKVLRPAQVTVSEGPPDDGNADDSSGDDTSTAGAPADEEAADGGSDEKSVGGDSADDPTEDRTDESSEE